MNTFWEESRQSSVDNVPHGCQQQGDLQLRQLNRRSPVEVTKSTARRDGGPGVQRRHETISVNDGGEGGSTFRRHGLHTT